MNWKNLFERYGDYVVPARYYENEGEFTVEELYQAFKERLEHEKMLEAHHELCNLRHNDDPCNCADYR